MKRVHRRLFYKLFFIAASLFLSNQGFSQAQDSIFSARLLKKLSLEDLMNVEVTSVSKTPQKLAEVASAIQVLTGEDIRRSSATSLPEALRLASNLQVAQTNSHDWAITSRGFNGAPLSNASLANKLLVMIDGRSVYNPLFSGVFWDAQNVLLEDIDRIEVVSGPGGTIWGDNAVNGVINILSKTADKTQGLYASAAVGTFLQDQAGIRFGGKAGDKVFYRVYGQLFNDKSTGINDTTDAKDNWNMVQGGFRLDYYMSKKNTITVQGDLYSGDENTPKASINGQNILARWTHKFSETSDLKLQAYFDRTFRNMANIAFTDEIKTFDIDLQHNFLLGKRQQITWGGSFRSADDHAKNSPALTFTPADINLILVTGFVQDQVTILKDRLKLTVGTKLSNNHYTGFEYQPSGRLAFTPNAHHTIWAAVSRAIRVPSRLDADELLPSVTTPNGKFASEKVLAYELGYRLEPIQRMAISLAGFYNLYTDVRSINANPNGNTPRFILANDQKARTWGVEVSANYWMFDWWHLRMGYTYLGKKFKALSAGVVRGADVFEGLDPHHQTMLQSSVDLHKNIQLDVTGRFVDSLTIWPLSPLVSQYFSLDMRLAWQFKKFELSIVGRDLLARRHIEFGVAQIPRNIYARLICRI